MSKAVLEWAIMGDLAVMFSSDGDVPAASWQKYLAELKANRVTKILSLTPGHTSLTSVQRKEAADIAKAQGIVAAVVTDDRLVRGMLTALSWLGVNVKGFSWDEIKEALHYMGVSPVYHERVIATADQLKVRVAEAVHRTKD